MFLLRKFIAVLLFPASICAGLLIAGLALVLFTRRQKLGKVLLSAGVLLFALSTQGAVGDALLGPLESQYPALHDPLGGAEREARMRPKWIVALGGGYKYDPRVPVTSRHSGASLHRLIEAIRLQRMVPGAKLILSGGKPFGGTAEGRGMEVLALALGVDPSALLVEERSRNTRDQAVFIGRIVGKDSFILVTSASHMPRAMGMFRKEGMNPIPAPTDHRVAESNSPRIFRYVPSAGALKNTRRAVYEFLGLAWARMRGQIE